MSFSRIAAKQSPLWSRMRSGKRARTAELEVRPVGRDELGQLVQAEETIHHDDVFRIGVQALRDERPKLLGRGSLKLDADHRAQPTLLQPRLEFSDQVFRLFLDLDVGVADQAENAMRLDLAAGEQVIEEERHQALQRDHPALGLASGRPAGRQIPESSDLGGEGRERVEQPSVRNAPDLQHQRERQVRDEREGVRRIDGQRRQHREQLGQEARLQRGALGLGDFMGGDVAQSFARQFGAQLAPAGLLIGHQVGGGGVDPKELLGGGQAVLADHPDPLAHLGLQPGHADHVEFVEVVGADGQEPEPLQQGVARVGALGQHSPVEGQPRQFAVEEARRRRDQVLDGHGRRLLRRGQRGGRGGDIVGRHRCFSVGVRRDSSVAPKG